MSTFRREERLKSEIIIRELFKKGQSFGQYPLRLIWLPIEEQQGNFPVLFAVSVPKRKFPKAVHRNQLKRLIREAYRLQKGDLYEVLAKEGEHYAFMVLYVAKELKPYTEVESAMRKMLKRFLRKRK